MSGERRGDRGGEKGRRGCSWFRVRGREFGSFLLEVFPDPMRRGWFLGRWLAEELD